MRGVGAHRPPEPAWMMPAPEDNTLTHVDRQVWAYSRANPAHALLIHTESAREIASWYASAGPEGDTFTAFATTGSITRGLLAGIEREIAKSWDGYDRKALHALRAYVAASNI